MNVLPSFVCNMNLARNSSSTHVSAESVSPVYANSRDGLFDQEQEGQTSIVQRVKDGNVQPLKL